MKAMIKEHVYAKKSDTRLYEEPVEEKAAFLLSKGDWLGILSRKDKWLHVLSSQGEGWVRQEDVEKRSPFLLHISWSPGKPIQYISASA